MSPLWPLLVPLAWLLAASVRAALHVRKARRDAQVEAVRRRLVPPHYRVSVQLFGLQGMQHGAIASLRSKHALATGDFVQGNDLGMVEAADITTGQVIGVVVACEPVRP